MRKTPEKTRLRIVELRTQHKLRHKDIAERLSLSLVTVYRILRENREVARDADKR